ncbi:DUF4332 domain-containing protein [Laspinema olomoucense]|uniref:DUF4332 domain-containing protein n=1 Tax=Laspinema olomoucense D3b TaxID=2953688 RepID=A0ABT2ND77_9CYAN|nr:DUF4332 domain-containing protein [Laspinema sp. D3b]MCT7980643.1 DUF4332 domain-containing protein [Laspinema sp. D3b]
MNASKSRQVRPLKPTHWPIAQLPGVSSHDQNLLETCGITTTGELLRRGKTPEQRQAIASELGIHLQYVNKWVAMAELASIPTVGYQYCGLLLHAGIASIAQLADLPIHRLHQQLLRVQVANLQRRDLCPSVDEVTRWIQQARTLIKG